MCVCVCVHVRMRAYVHAWRARVCVCTSIECARASLAKVSVGCGRVAATHGSDGAISFRRSSVAVGLEYNSLVRIRCVCVCVCYVCDGSTISTICFELCRIIIDSPNASVRQCPSNDGIGNYRMR